MTTYPSDWKVVPLGEVGDVAMCRRVLKSQTMESGDVPFFKIGTFGRAPDAYISHDLYESLRGAYSFPKCGDVLVSAAGTIGRTVVYDGEDAYYQDSNIVWIENDESKVLNSYLYWWYKVIEWKTENGGTVDRLYNKNFLSSSIAYPPLPEQKRIAGVLGDMDKLIENLGKRIEKKRQIKKGAMQELLTGKKRLSGFTGEWVESCMGDIGSFYGGLSGKSAPDFGHGDAQYITFLNVLNNVVIDSREVGKVYVADGEKQNAVMKGDLFFNGSSETPEEVAMCAALLEDLPNTYLNSFCCGFRLKSADEDPLYISYYFNSGEGRQLVSTMAQGLTRYNLSKKAFLAAKVTWPPLPEQRAIAAVLSDMDAEIANLERRQEKLKQVKKGMLQDLLTGKVRLKGQGGAT